MSRWVVILLAVHGALWAASICVSARLAYWTKRNAEAREALNHATGDAA